MTPECLQANTSFLLGRVHGGIRAIIDSQTSMESRLLMLEELELELRNDIARIYYPTLIEASPT